MSSLSMLVSESLKLSQAIAEAGGELTPEIESLLAVNERGLAEKIDSYVFALDVLGEQHDHWKAKGQEMTKVAKSFESAKERLKDNIKFAMNSLGSNEALGVDFRFKLSPVKPSLVVDEALISSEFKKEVTTLVVDKDKLRAALESGQVIEGAKLVQGVALRSYTNKK